MIKNLIEKACKIYNIGEPISAPSFCEGGLVNQNWKFATTQGEYVLKLLNPAIMAKPSRFEAYRVSEFIARELQKTLSVVPALMQHGDPLLALDNQALMIFPYINAKILTSDLVHLQHVKKIGEAFALIHHADIKHADASEAELLSLSFLNNDSYRHQLNVACPNIAKKLNQLRSPIQTLIDTNKKNESILKSHLIISHLDCDPKDVLWDENQQYYIIDWEAAGLINKTKNTVVTALYWSMDSTFKVNHEFLTAFLSAYLKTKNSQIDLAQVEVGLYGLLADWLNWIDFNLLRLLNNPMDSAEYKLGESESLRTLNAIPIVLSQFSTILKTFYAVS